MSARLARLVPALYPLSYRRRYGDEMAALIEDSGGSPAAVVDLLRGAVSAHLRPESSVARGVTPDERRRLGVSTVLLCWVLFALAGLALYKTTEGSGFEGGGPAPGLLGGLRLAIQILAALGSTAVVLGAAPLVLAALRQGAGRPEVRRATRLAFGCACAFVAATAALVLAANAGPGLPGGIEALILAGWALIALGCGLGCAIAARRGLLAIVVPGGAVRFARACAIAVIAAMVGIALLAAAYLVALATAAPALAGEPNGPLGAMSVAASLAILLGIMAAVSLPACREAWHLVT
jgi:hypothetical protein